MGEQWVRTADLTDEQRAALVRVGEALWDVFRLAEGDEGDGGEPGPFERFLVQHNRLLTMSVEELAAEWCELGMGDFEEESFAKGKRPASNGRFYEPGEVLPADVEWVPGAVWMPMERLSLDEDGTYRDPEGTLWGPDEDLPREVPLVRVDGDGEPMRGVPFVEVDRDGSREEATVRFRVQIRETIDKHVFVDAVDVEDAERQIDELRSEGFGHLEWDESREEVLGFEQVVRGFSRKGGV
jgi:hypothetical protein